MKLSLTRKAKPMASALLTTLVICSILSMFVMYYLSLIDQQSYLNSRSQIWNLAIAVSEAGVEDGLQQLNTAFPDMNTDGWTYDGSTCYYKSNSLPDGSSYIAYIFMTNWATPTVLARAYVASLPRYGMAAPDTFFAAVGVSNPSAPTTVTRSVFVQTKRNSPFQVALLSKLNIDLNGNGLTIDSFDSTDPTKSVNGQYVASFYSGDRGDIATDLGVIDSINGGNANIYGHAHTGPGSPSTAAQIGANGYIGPHATFANGTIAPGWWLPDANFTFPDVTYPNTAGYLTPTGGMVAMYQTNLSPGASSTYTYPTMPPAGGQSTNFGAFVTSVTFPIPVPPDLTTNIYNNVSSYPNPAPAFVGTNTTPQTQNTAPIFGTYLGSVAITNWNNGKYGTFYTFDQITGYSWQTYTYPTQYGYTAYATNVISVTNQYDQILWGTSDLGLTNYYVANSIGGQTIVLGENVVLALPNGLIQQGSDNLTLSSGQNLIGGTLPQAGINIYAGGTSGSLSGQGVGNTSGYAGNFIVWFAPTVTTLSYSGNAGFCGALCAPSANVNMNGGGNGSNSDFIGAVIGNSVTMNGHFSFHYDAALAGINKRGRFIIFSWNEVK
jgi:hypothetical protein